VGAAKSGDHFLIKTPDASGFAGDISISLDETGVIRSARFGRELIAQSLSDWHGSTWTDTVAEMTRDKAERLLDEARSNGVTGFRQIEQRLPDGGSVPVEYAAIRQTDSSGTLLVGRDLRGMAELQRRYVAAQQTLERDYWKLRRIETRYRMIFRESSEAGIVADPETHSILDANPSALQLLGLDVEAGLTSIAGRSLVAEAGPEDRDELRRYLDLVHDRGEAAPIRITFGPGRVSTLVRASATREESGVTLFVRVTPWEDGMPEVRPRPVINLSPIVDTMPDGFVLVDRDGRVRYANQAFADLVQNPRGASVLGRELQHWLARPGADWSVMRSNLERHGVVRLFSTSVQGDFGTDTQVEISAAPVVSDDASYAALVVRDISRRISPGDEAGRQSVTLDDLAAEVGRTTLPRLVSDTTASVEKHLISHALELTGGNRTAAAQLLGVSRQSLYSKLDRYGIDDSE
jgi:transcriptional regulator PpsR